MTESRASSWSRKSRRCTRSRRPPTGSRPHSQRLREEVHRASNGGSLHKGVRTQWYDLGESTCGSSHDPGQDSGPRRGLLPRYTLKDGDTFLLADALGDIHDRDDGLFTNDTRMLSRFELSIAQRPVSLLGAAVSEDNTAFSAHLTNRPLPALGERVIPQGVIHIERCRLLLNGRLYERLRLTNFSNQAAEVPVRWYFAADFVDIFEIQGHVRPPAGSC